MQWDELFSKNDDVTFEQIGEFINSPSWYALNDVMTGEYKIKPSLTYSGCSMQKGWNVKYKKSGKALCTVYPVRGYFLALVYIGEKSIPDADKAIGAFSRYTKELYEKTEISMGGKWLMIKVDSEKILQDVIALIKLKMFADKRTKA